MARVFHQVDVFATAPLSGNPLAVVADAEGLSTAQMAGFARWTNLSETTFLLPPRAAGADYRVRIFTPLGELPFAGHPTLGSAAVWLACGGQPQADEIVQECDAGQIRVRRETTRLSFAAPALARSGPVDPDLLAQICTGLKLGTGQIEAAEWVDNGPGWLALLLKDHAHLLAVTPDFAMLNGLRVGLVARCPARHPADFELRAFTAAGFEDPVTGSLNAGVAQWLIGAGIAPETYVARQGTRLRRCGEVHVSRDGSDIWVGGEVQPRITGKVRLEPSV
jgi:PhzF family phenazine biosynthesis protein